MQHTLSMLLFTPLFVGLLLLLVPSAQTKVFKWTPIIVGLAQFAILAMAFKSYDISLPGYQLMEQHSWLSFQLGGNSSFQSDYIVGVDGLSFPLVALSVIVLLIASVSSLSIRTQCKGYSVLLLLLNGAIFGTFLSLDLLVFFIFFEFMLIPMYFLIGIWGGKNREYASVKFLLYTLLGSLFILVAVVGIYLSYQSNGVHTFDIRVLSNIENAIPDGVLSPDSPSVGRFTFREWAFLLLFVGFLIKLPSVPFHTWLPDAHVEAPTPVSVVLAALLLKIGGYGLLRIAYPIFSAEAASFAWLAAILGAVSILYGALNALASRDFKKLVAYSSVSHIGFVLVGIASGTVEGIAGAAYQLVSHGFLAAMLFLAVGVIYDRAGDRTIANYSGLASRMKCFTAFVLIAFFASAGLPGFSGFVAEVLVLFGAFGSPFLAPWIGGAATFGIILSAAYFLWTIQRMFFGPFQSAIACSWHDLTKRELVMFVPLALCTLALGVYPQCLMNFLNPFAIHWVQSVIHSTPR
ncbi:MAG: oxidoreductase [Candidatus Nephrothrix sp. EaCA]|nr:MAG: oxidoreductase [Candidatus Nephrothrix sp. EaCA]